MNRHCRRRTGVRILKIYNFKNFLEGQHSSWKIFFADGDDDCVLKDFYKFTEKQLSWSPCRPAAILKKLLSRCFIVIL